MKVSLNWIREYLDFELPATSEVVVKIGAQIGGVDEVTELGPRYERVLIVRVVTCEKLENSDHLNVCMIDDGRVATDVERDEQGFVRVVCGAANVRVGITVAWLPPGATVPSSYDAAEPFVLSARPLRGVISNGMLASPAELAIGDNHDGILELEGDHEPGASFAGAFGLNDTIIDIENKMFTHRPDCFGQLGVAREIAGIFGQQFDTSKLYNTDVQAAHGDDAGRLEIRNEIPELVPRFAAQIFDSLTVAPSPVWLQTKLSRVGMRPINNIVDVTNYCMMLTGQPLHAYDYDKLLAIDGADHATIVVRQPHSDEELTLLNGKKIKPRSEAILISSASQAIGLGGVMGGADSEVDDTTTRIVLESASFDMYSVRRTSMQHGLFSDAVTRFNKGQSPLQNLHVLAVARELLVQFGATAADTIYDLRTLPEDTLERNSLHPAITILPEFVNARLGLSLSGEVMQRLLINVEFDVQEQDGALIVLAPFWRTDIELREDIVEEIGRLYGFDQLPHGLPRREIMPVRLDSMLELKQTIRSVLSRAGANELLTYSFVHGNLLDKVGQDKQQAFKLSNALSPDLQYYRLSLTPSLLEKIHPNVKAGYDRFGLFELGKSHAVVHADDTEQVPREYDRIAFVYAADSKAAQQLQGAAYYQAHAYLMVLLDKLGIAERASLVPLESHDYAGRDKLYTSYYAVGRAASICIDDHCLGQIGEYTAASRQALKLPDYVAGFELDLAMLLKYASSESNYVPLPRFPKVVQDITLRVLATVTYQQLYDIAALVVREAGNRTYWTLEPLAVYQSGDDSEHRNISLRLSTANYDRTMTDSEVAVILNAVATAANQALQAERI